MDGSKIDRMFGFLYIEGGYIVFNDYYEIKSKMASWKCKYREQILSL